MSCWLCLAAVFFSRCAAAIWSGVEVWGWRFGGLAVLLLRLGCFIEVAVGSDPELRSSVRRNAAFMLVQTYQQPAGMSNPDFTTLRRLFCPPSGRRDAVCQPCFRESLLAS